MEMFSNLPTPIKWVLGVTGIGALIGTGAAMTSGNWAFLIVLVLLLVVVLGGYLLVLAWRRKKRNAQLGGELAQHSAASPRGISDPGQRARLDDLRKKFDTGVTEYRSRGKDLYKLPWYVIVGEPGSGKTEAVRHSNVGFPPGMQDEFQGVGGTINMNWWFTNHAVLLDTAGRLMFEEVKPGETSEWKEFLTLLKKNRPNCPINGLFLVIPSDSLIKDSADDIARKAGKIAQQLDVIQRVLDVRFPVFVIITKCDKIVGFREFFDDLTDPQLQHQMLGWSNPDQLDTPFRPELVDQHLDKVVQRLRRRRLGLLRDPVPANETARRTDEVDSLYALPYSLSTLAPRMRRYLETIFIAGEWSAKPLFLRGIYFSSSMREGSELDEELAKSMGVSVDDLPEGKVWEKDRAYFLRDLFIDKVFKERGLVTRASNTKSMLRTQQVLLFGCIFLAVTIFIAVAWLGKKRLQQDVESHSRTWVLATNWWEDKTWKQSIVPDNGGGNYADAVTNRFDVNGTKFEIGEFYRELQSVATNQLKKNWLLPGLANNYNQNSKKAQRIVFEGGVVKPLVEATRKKMFRNSPTFLKGEADALAALVNIEAGILDKSNPALDAESAKSFLSSLLTYVTGQDKPLDANTLSNLVSTMVWTYATSANEQPRVNWPPAWLSEANGANTNLALIAGLEHCSRTATNSIQEQLNGWNSLALLRDALRRFDKSETDLFHAAQGNDATAVKKAYADLEQAHKAVAEQFDKNASSALFADHLLASAFAKFRQSVELTSTNLLAGVEKANSKGRKDNPTHPLFPRIQAQLAGYQSSLSGTVTQLVPPAEVEELKKFDERFLANGSYEKRWAAYEQAQRLAQEKIFEAGNLVNSRGEQLEAFVTNKLAKAKAAGTAYTGSLATDFNSALAYLLSAAEKAQREQFLSAYIQEADGELKKSKRFPLIKSTGAGALTRDELNKARVVVYQLSTDLASPAFQSFSARQYPTLAGLTNRVATLSAVLTGIFGNASTPGRCKISLAKPSDGSKPADQWRETWHYIKMSCPGPNCELNSEQNTSDTQNSLLGTVTSLDQGFQIDIIKSREGGNKLTYEVKDWGALALLVNHARPLSDGASSDLRTWIVDWSREPADPKIPLILEFDRPLPEAKNWPAD